MCICVCKKRHFPWARLTMHSFQHGKKPFISFLDWTQLCILSIAKLSRLNEYYEESLLITEQHNFPGLNTLDVKATELLISPAQTASSRAKLFFRPNQICGQGSFAGRSKNFILIPHPLEQETNKLWNSIFQAKVACLLLIVSLAWSYLQRELYLQVYKAWHRSNSSALLQREKHLWCPQKTTTHDAKGQWCSTCLDK